jgi:WD40 repeat protein
MKRLTLAAAFVFAICLALVLVGACGHEEKVPATPEAAATVTPTLAPPATLEAPSVRFVPAEPLFFTGEESSDPFAGERPGPTGWSVYLVRGDGQPELISQTNRWVWDLQWAADGRTVMAWFRSGTAAGLLGLQGIAFFDVAGSSVATSELLVEQARLIELSPDLSRLALEVGPDESRVAWEVYVADRSGRAWKLEGLGDKVRPIGWLPDGSGLLVYTVEGPTTEEGLLYLVPSAGGPATPVAPDVVTNYQVAWSPDGSRLAYLSGGDLHVFDRASGQSRQITSGAGYRFERPQWSADGSEVVLGGDLIDLATGDVVASLLPPGQGWTPASALSPDGRYFVVTEWCEGETYSENRIRLYDRETGQVRLLRDCDQGVHASQWLPDGHRLLLVAPSCWGCETVTFSITSMDVESGNVVPLTNGLEPHAAAYVSPDGSRLMVTGKALRLYAEDGQLLRELVAPEDFDVAAAAWSPDGSSFVYVIGPIGFFLL